jgi:hypothetical protein
MNAPLADENKPSAAASRFHLLSLLTVVNLRFEVIAPAVLASVEFVITPKTIRYQMAVSNGGMQ